MRAEAPFKFQPNPERLAEIPSNLVLIGGSSNVPLFRNVARLLHMQDLIEFPMGKPFADGEMLPKILQNLRKRAVTILQSTSPPHADRAIVEIGLIADAVIRASADKQHIGLVLPYFGYARQDRKVEPRTPISASYLANRFLDDGITHLATVDIHALQIPGMVRQTPWDNIPTERVLVPEITKMKVDNLILVSPDTGGEKRVENYARIVGTDFATISKHRDPDRPDEVGTHGINGNVQGKDCVIVDDIISTGRTLASAANLLLDEGGARSVQVVATHGVFADRAVETLHNSRIDGIVYTDTILPGARNRSALKQSGKFRRVTVADLIAQSVYSDQTGDSLSEALYYN